MGKARARARAKKIIFLILFPLASALAPHLCTANARANERIR
jgi:hypothetical protein